MTAVLEEQLAVPHLAKPCKHCRGLGVLEATDIFAGAGGSSLGLENVRCHWCDRALIVVTQALNHNVLAVEAHNHNFPFADHDVHDVQEVPPSRFRRTDVLWASPECGHHAYCRGTRDLDEAAVRSRATFNDIVRFTAYHRYDAVIVENVIEARLWCDTPSHPDKCNCGGHFDRWYQEMLDLGYEGQIVMFNSQFALPTPQSRDRMYVVFWRKGLPPPALDFRPSAWCSSCESVVNGIQTWKTPTRGSVRTQPGKHEYGRYGTQYIYICPNCEERVAPAVTGARTALDFTLPMERIGDKKKPLAVKTMARIVGGIQKVGNVDAVIVPVGGHLYERRPGVRVWSVDSPLRTVHATLDRALVTRLGGQSSAPRAAGEPMGTITAHDRQIGLVLQKSSNGIGRDPDEAMPAVTASSGDHMLVLQNMENNVAKSVAQPLPPVTTGGNHMLVAFRNNGTAASLNMPAPTVTAGGNHHGLLVYNGVPGFVRSIEDAAGTITARDKQSLLVPYYSSGVAHSTEEPAGTVTSKDRNALVFAEADVNDCFFRMLQWPELLRAQQMHRHGDGRDYELTARKKNRRGKITELSNEDRVRMIGMAVSSPVATLLGYALLPTLGGSL